MTRVRAEGGEQQQQQHVGAGDEDEEQFSDDNISSEGLHLCLSESSFLILLLRSVHARKLRKHLSQDFPCLFVLFEVN